MSLVVFGLLIALYLWHCDMVNRPPPKPIADKDPQLYALEQENKELRMQLSLPPERRVLPQADAPLDNVPPITTCGPWLAASSKTELMDEYFQLKAKIKDETTPAP